MKILNKNIKKNTVKLEIENLDDLWYTSYIVDIGDIVSSKTIRKIKLGEGDQRSVKIVKKEIYLSIQVEKIEFHKYSDILRVSGKVTLGKDDVPSGSYHTINIEIGTKFEVVKKKFLKYQIEKIEESSKKDESKILICIHDREEGIFVLLKKYGYEILFNISGNVSKKADVNVNTSDFYSDLYKKILELDKRYNFSSIIIASPTFWKEYLVKKITNENIKKKILLATSSSVGRNAINEIIKRPEVQSALKQERFSKEMKLVDNLLSEISKHGKAEYGIDKVKEATESGSVSELLLTDEFIFTKRQDEKFEEIDKLMRKIDSMNGKIHIISSEHEGGKKLDGLGGIATLLRYKMSY